MVRASTDSELQRQQRGVCFLSYDMIGKKDADSFIAAARQAVLVRSVFRQDTQKEGIYRLGAAAQAVPVRSDSVLVVSDDIYYTAVDQCVDLSRL